MYPNCTKHRCIIWLCSYWCLYLPFIKSITYKAHNMNKLLIWIVALGMLVLMCWIKVYMRAYILPQNSKIILLIISLCTLYFPDLWVHYWQILHRDILCSCACVCPLYLPVIYLFPFTNKNVSVVVWTIFLTFSTQAHPFLYYGLSFSTSISQKMLLLELSITWLSSVIWVEHNMKI